MNLLRVLFQATLRSQLQAAEQQLQQESIIERFGIWNGIVFVFVFFVFFSTRCAIFPFVIFCSMHVLLFSSMCLFMCRLLLSNRLFYIHWPVVLLLHFLFLLFSCKIGFSFFIFWLMSCFMFFHIHVLFWRFFGR